MIVRAVTTRVVVPGGGTLLQLLDETITELPEGSILAITSKVVSICEGRVVPIEGTNKSALVQQESQHYLPAEATRYDFELAIANNTLVPSAGIDSSNGGSYYVLWPNDPQGSANQAREFLAKRFGLEKVGVVITDSTCTPLRWGVTGIALAHSGFEALHSYVGQPDLFGRPFEVSQANIAGGLAAAAVLEMGEGAESTPIAIIEAPSRVSFQSRNPTAEELAALVIDPKDDVFAPLLTSVDWQKGDKSAST